MKLFDYPVDSNSRISQMFGENPAAYKKFGLLGHNGIDFAVPIGTRVYACDAGVVREIATDPNGYGLYIKMDHSWGESIYGHLSSTLIKVGESVGRKQAIAVSGNTGNSTGPHLHFGIRIKPYSRDDGWNGHSDPYPYLTDKDNTYIMGTHIIGGVNRHLDVLKKLQPAIVLVLDPNKDEVINLKLACPNTKIIGRIYKPDNEVADLIRNDPLRAAREMHNAVLSHEAFGHVDYWQSWVNEVCQVDWTEFQNLVKCELERMKLATTYKCAIFAFSVGNPDMPASDRMTYWKATYPALDYAEKYNHVVALHQYGCKPNIWGPAERGGPDWLIHRLEHQVLPNIPQKKLKFVVTEFGHDYLIVSPPAEQGGWKTRDNYKNNPQAYANDLINVGKYLERFSGRILGYAIFTLGHNSPWESYDIQGDVLNILANDNQSPVVHLDIEDVLGQIGDDSQVIQINPLAALTKVAIKDGVLTQVSQETTVTFDNIEYVLAKFENITTGESYVYYVEKNKWDQVKRIRRK